MHNSVTAYSAEGKPQGRETEGDKTECLLVSHENASATNP